MQPSETTEDALSALRGIQRSGNTQARPTSYEGENAYELAMTVPLGMTEGADIELFAETVRAYGFEFRGVRRERQVSPEFVFQHPDPAETVVLGE